MKKLFVLAAMSLLICFCFSSCVKEDIKTDSDQDVYVVQLGFSGDLDVNYEPMTRAGSDDLYGIQVYSMPDNSEANASWKNYAYGLFDSMDNVTIKLLKGYKYKFVATMVVDAKNVLNSHDYVNYWGPFNKSGDEDGSCAVTNAFDYQATTYLNGLGSGSTYLKNPREIFSHPNTKRYYGELTDYVPSSKGAKAKIKMKQVNFGAKFIAKGKAASAGSFVDIQIKGAPKMVLEVTQNNKHITEYFVFSNVAKAWAEGSYSEVITVNLNWRREDGSVIPLGAHDIEFKRNATAVVNVSVVNDGSDDGVGVELVTEEFIEDENQITVEDGEIVDTEVETNK